MRIIVVCGAGASSTFVATRLQRAATAAGVPLDAVARSLTSIAEDVATADAILLGAHSAESAGDVLVLAAPRGIPVVPLPSDIARDRDGTRALSLVQDTL